MFQKSEAPTFFSPVTILNTEVSCCILRGPGGERIVDVVPGGTEFETQVKTGSWGMPHTLAIIPTSSVLEFIVHKL